MKYLILILLLSSCSANYHLRQAKRHLTKAEQKGATIKTDTVFKTIITERTKTDTLLQFQDVYRFLHDTLEVETIKWKTKTKFDTIKRTIFQQVECKPDTIRVPVQVNTDIQAGYSNWQKMKLCLLALIAGILISRLFWK